MQNFSLDTTSSSLQSSLNNTMTNLIDQVTPQLPHTSFVTDLAFLMIIGTVITLAFFKIKQPLIIGYLFAGMLLGPLSPMWSWLLPNTELASHFRDFGILHNVTALHLFSDLGVILLLFTIGLEFPLAKIRRIGKTAIGVGTIGLLATLGVVFYAALALGLNFMDSLFIAAALSISSTAVIVKILEEMGKIRKESSFLILAILIVEDVIAVILISSLQSVALVGTVSIESIVVVILMAIGLIVGTFTVGIKVFPPLIDRIAAAEHREILLLSILGVCFGYSLLANSVGLSVAIGAFLGGVIISESKSSEVSKLITNPIKDMFVAVFFISVGALMDISHLEDYIWIAIVLIAVATGMKLGGNMIGNFIFRQKRSNTVSSAFTLAAPRGEFSIVIIKTGIDIGAVSAFLFPLIGIITIITTFLSPFMMRASDKVVSALQEKDA